METTRQKKFARTVQKELSQLLNRPIEGLDTMMITVTHVRVTPDLQIARAYITCFPEGQLKLLLRYLNEEQRKYRHELAGRIKDIRSIPTLEFYEDDTLAVANRIDELLSTVHIPDEEPAEAEPTGEA